MKSCGNLSLKSSYKHLQKKMWEISEKAHQINKQNQFLKGKVITQRIMIKKRKNQTSYSKNVAPQKQQASNMAKNLQKCYKVNSTLKQNINNLQEQKKQIFEQLNQIQKLKRKHKKLQQMLKKISKVLKKGQKAQSIGIGNRKLDKEHAIVCHKFEVAQKQQEEIVVCIQQALAQLQDQKRLNKLLSSEILGLIEQKNYLKKACKIQKGVNPSGQKN